MSCSAAAVTQKHGFLHKIAASPLAAAVAAAAAADTYPWLLLQDA
jgi:hypothetical protein